MTFFSLGNSASSQVSFMWKDSISSTITILHNLDLELNSASLNEDETISSTTSIGSAYAISILENHTGFHIYIFWFMSAIESWTWRSGFRSSITSSISFFSCTWCSYYITIDGNLNDTELSEDSRDASLSTHCHILLLWPLFTCWEFEVFNIEDSSKVTSMLRTIFLSSESHSL